MTRYGRSLIAVVLVAIAVLTATPAVGAPTPDRADVNHPGAGRVATVPTADGGNLSLETGRSRASGRTVSALSCWTYWGEITRYTSIGNVQWRWRHTAEACYDGVVVLQWRQQYDQLMMHDGSAYMRDAFSKSATQLPATPAVAFFQRQLDICFWNFCWASDHPWVRININGDGTAWYNWGVA
jgi:hypothetical protein